MGKAGRKRKAGPREANGKLQRPTLRQIEDAERRRRMAETQFVARQPHRGGDASPEAGSVLGRFCLRLKLPPELMQAGERYGGIVARWRSCKGVPVTRNETPGPTPDPMSKEDEDKRAEKIRRVFVEAERELIGQGTEALFAVRQLVVDEYDLSFAQDAHAIMGLTALAEHLGLLGRHPYGGGR